jgi:RNA polymerase sigma factor (sigma-70 family)
MHDRPFPFGKTLASIAAVPTVTSSLAADPEAFATAIERHRPDLHRHCTRVLRSGEDAEDAVQEALLRAWRSRRKLVSDCPRAWLFRIATNACLDVLARRDATLAPLGDESCHAAIPHDEHPESIVLAQESVERILDAAMDLPPGQRDSFLMRDVLDRSAAESATTLSITVAATNSALQRARCALRDRLA